MLGLLTRAVAWDRDAYALGLATRWSWRAQIRVNGRRARRALAALGRGFQRVQGAPAIGPDVISPDDAAACYKLGLSLRALKRDEEALNWLRRASDLRPGDAESARELGDVLTALKRNEEAIAAYRHALSLQPDSISVLLNLGGRLQEAKRFQEAAAILILQFYHGGCDGG